MNHGNVNDPIAREWTLDANRGLFNGITKSRHMQCVSVCGSETSVDFRGCFLTIPGSVKNKSNQVSEELCSSDESYTWNRRGLVPALSGIELDLQARPNFLRIPFWSGRSPFTRVGLWGPRTCELLTFLIYSKFCEMWIGSIFETDPWPLKLLLENKYKTSILCLVNLKVLQFTDSLHSIFSHFNFKFSQVFCKFASLREIIVQL